MGNPTQRNFLKALGPGLLWAGAAVGVSHLVQSTRAGASFGLELLGLVIIANVFKYPAFSFGPRYAAATGTSLLEGHRRGIVGAGALSDPDIGRHVHRSGCGQGGDCGYWGGVAGMERLRRGGPTHNLPQVILAKEVPQVAPAGAGMVAYSWAGIIFSATFALCFLWVRWGG